ncbi:MAG: hypothetical protein AB8B58_07455 [Roseobacter sp.]
MERDQTTPEEVVILVHGTFATDPDDKGERWWQKGSFFYEELSKRLPDHIRLVEPGEMFRWGGENSNVHRVGAALDLYKRVKEYEERGVRYHIVAHSHGGTAAWIMLFIAQDRLTQSPEIRGATEMPSLERLGSLITLGTPFIHLKAKPSKTSWLSESRFALVSGAVGGVCILSFPGQVEILLFAVFVLWVLAYVFGLVGFLMHSVQLRQTQMLSVPDSIIEPYKDRWLGLWAENDEAIDLLGVALKLIGTPQTLKAVDADFPSAFFANPLFHVVLQPVLRLKRMWRGFTMPILDTLLKRRLAAILLGVQDVDTVKAIEPWPHLSLERASALPPPVQADLKAQCDAALAASSGGARPALQYLSLGAVDDAMQAFGDTNKALIHNSYFDHPAVIDIIAARIRGEREQSP